MIAFNCPTCGNKLGVHDNAAGKRGKCPNCHQIVTVPTVSDVPVAKSHKPPQLLDTEPEQDDADPRRLDERDEDDDTERLEKGVNDNERT
jgi:hypothetical protein